MREYVLYQRKCPVIRDSPARLIAGRPRGVSVRQRQTGNCRRYPLRDRKDLMLVVAAERCSVAAWPGNRYIRR